MAWYVYLLTRDDVVVMCVLWVCVSVWEEKAVVGSLEGDGGSGAQANPQHIFGIILIERDNTHRA